MEQDNVAYLEEEIELLKSRIAILERRENTRKAFSYAKLIWKIILFCALVFAIWKGYDYVVHTVPQIVEEKVKAVIPFKKS